MNNPMSFTSPTRYFLQEGTPCVGECLENAFAVASARGIQKLIIFTSFGDGVRLAIERIAGRFPQITMIAVTFPKSSKLKNGEPISLKLENADLFKTHQVQVVTADTFPFHSKDSKDRESAIRDTLKICGGGFPFAVQAILMACDQGAVRAGEHVVSCAADCAILAMATQTKDFIPHFYVREFIAHPVVRTITRRETIEGLFNKAPFLAKAQEAEGQNKQGG
jgi:hypothetical protein